MGKGIEAFKVITTVILASTVILSAEYSGIHGNPYKAVPSPGGTVDWLCPVIYDGWMYFTPVHTDTLITEGDVITLIDDPTIPRRPVIYGDGGIAVTSACVATYLGPTVDSIREAIAYGESVTGRPYTDTDTALVLRNFLAGIEYTLDEDQYGCVEYWATPAETLYAGKGDCDDQAILFATLGRVLGLDTALIMSPDHAQGGVRLDGPNGFPTVDGYTVVECCSEGRLRILSEDDDLCDESYLLLDSTWSRMYAGYTALVRSCAEWLNPIITPIYDVFTT